jgi:hypothetical protein
VIEAISFERRTMIATTVRLFVVYSTEYDWSNAQKDAGHFSHDRRLVIVCYMDSQTAIELGIW